MTDRGRFLRENVFLVAAVALPLVIVGLFLAAAAVPRWTVPPPAYDLVLRTAGWYGDNRPHLWVDIGVRDGRVEAVVRRVAADSASQVPRLYLVDHVSFQVREIPLELPATVADDQPITVPVAALAGKNVVAGSTSPDGYTLDMRTNQGSGLVTGLFGMDRYRQRVTIVKNSRVIPITMPTSEYVYGVTAIGWVVREGGD